MSATSSTLYQQQATTFPSQSPRRFLKREALFAAFQPSATRRFAIATITPKLDPRAYPLPEIGKTPRVCCFNGYRCANALRYKIDESYLCIKHTNLFWESHFVSDHRVIRLGGVHLV